LFPGRLRFSTLDVDRGQHAGGGPHDRGIERPAALWGSRREGRSMSTPRIRRLEKEHAGLLALKRQSSFVTFTAEGTPPTAYRIRMTCDGLCLDGHEPRVIKEHRFDLILGREFPILAPEIMWRSPIFHPNFHPPHICLGDHWYAGWSLAEMCVAICEMIQYKRFNIYDPLDRNAAIWLKRLMEERPDVIPIDSRPIRDLDFEVLPGKPPV
jgi:ubiquitin-protein ligase